MHASLASPSGRVVAVLGPTNTGKTHLAVERMLGHASGIIGLPLRLLAREIFDRIVAARGKGRVALVTGEEKIVPAQAQYYVCTVEAMPLERGFEFLAIDEIQLIGDPERGHVFTDRLLHARGRSETMFLGAEQAAPLIRRLVPEAEFIGRPRMSSLTFAGARKLSRLPKRTAIVAFSAQDVYAIAELVRRQRGGAAVVLGALSPRTRNAQVAMFQAREVDFLVATDAIGMGLNMAIEHVAFAATRKFDGLAWRDLTPAEVGQIAGRAGRHMNDGTFGVTGEVDALGADLVEKVENHRFDPLRKARWRNRRLDFTSLVSLQRSLESAPDLDCLERARDADDYLALKSLGPRSEIAGRSATRDRLRLLWEVCQIPDFRKVSEDQHHRLLAQIFLHLCDRDGRLPTDWVARHVSAQDRTDGDIDTLATRIAHIRTWTYITHRGDWMDEAETWRERARAIEDRLSDALHERLTQRFVDRRTAVLMSRLKDRAQMSAVVGGDGEVTLEGQYLGRIAGLSFLPDTSAGGSDGRALKAAANRSLSQAMHARAGDLVRAGDEQLALADDGRIVWRGAGVARLSAGDHVLRPRLKMIGGEQLDGQRRQQVVARLEGWLRTTIERRLGPLALLDETFGQGAAPAAARGLLFRVGEGLGKLRRKSAEDLLRQIPRTERGRLAKLGVRCGVTAVYMPALLKPAAMRLCGILWAVWRDAGEIAIPPPGRVSLPTPAGLPDGYLEAIGYRDFKGLAVRLDMVERLAMKAALASRRGPFPADAASMSLLGCGRDDLARVLKGLGYVEAPRPDGGADPWFAGRNRPGRRRPRRTSPAAVRPGAVAYDPNSPFAKLRELLPAE